MLGLLIMWVAIGIVWRILISAPVQATKWDAIIVPGGGLEEDGRPYDFVRARLDAALLLKAIDHITLNLFETYGGFEEVNLVFAVEDEMLATTLKKGQSKVKRP